MDFDRDYCLELLKNKAEELGRPPVKSDLDEYEVMRIKGVLGPWPRALEAAGLKDVRSDAHKQLMLEKRIRAKRRRTLSKIEKHKEDTP